MDKRIIKLEQFEGPLALLLRLIEDQKLEITEVSLAEVTDQYIAILEAQKNLYPEEITDFLLIASRLLLIKSRVLLPDYFAAEEEMEESDLERQLKMYKDYVVASRNINSSWKSSREFYTRPKPLRASRVRFLPPYNLQTADLQEIISAIVSELEPIVKIKTKKIDLTVTIKDKINLIKDLIRKKLSVDFERLLNGNQSKTERIVSFLAVLEMVKQREVEVSQETMFDNFVITRIK